MIILRLRLPKVIYIECELFNEEEQLLNIQSQLLEEKAKRELAKKSFKHFIKYMFPNFKFSYFNLKLIEDLQQLYE